MIRYSVLIPQRNAGSELARQLPELRRVLALLSLPYEVICIDRGSAPPPVPRSPSYSTSILFCACWRWTGRPVWKPRWPPESPPPVESWWWPSGRGTEYPLQQIPHLIAELSRTDIVFARQRLAGWAHAWQQLISLPQRWLLGPDARNADGLCWAARREAVAGLEPTRGTARFLPWLVAMRGFRVGETSVRFQPQRPSFRDAWPHPGDLLAVWWLRRRNRPSKVEELRVDLVDTPKPAGANPSHWIDAAQGLGRREADARQRDSAYAPANRPLAATLTHIERQPRIEPSPHEDLLFRR